MKDVFVKNIALTRFRMQDMLRFNQEVIDNHMAQHSIKLPLRLTHF